VDHQVNIPLQDGVDGPPVGLLDVDLPLVAAGLLMELGIPRVPQMCIRDVGYADYVPVILSISKPRLFYLHRSLIHE
jgi:hypothetical protein